MFSQFYISLYPSILQRPMLRSCAWICVWRTKRHNATRHCKSTCLFSAILLMFVFILVHQMHGTWRERNENENEECKCAERQEDWRDGTKTWDERRATTAPNDFNANTVFVCLSSNWVHITKVEGGEIGWSHTNFIWPWPAVAGHGFGFTPDTVNYAHSQRIFALRVRVRVSADWAILIFKERWMEEPKFHPVRIQPWACLRTCVVVHGPLSFVASVNSFSSFSYLIFSSHFHTTWFLCSFSSCLTFTWSSQTRLQDQTPTMKTGSFS